MNIPRIIHQIWFQGEPEIPKHLREYRETWIKIHPDYKMMLWDQVTIEKLLKEYNLPWLSELYYSYNIMVQKIDIAKYFILYKYGGIYVDMDMKCIKSLNNILNTDDNIILSHCNSPVPFRLFYGLIGHDISKSVVNNGVIIITPRNDLMMLVLKQAYKDKDSRVKDFNKALYIFKTTGPVCLENAIIEYKKTHKDNIKILDFTYFEGHEIGAKDYSIPENAIAIHIYEGSWVPESTALIIKLYFYFVRNPYMILIIILLIIALIAILKKRNKS